jgi:hypothetical protein
MQLKIDELTPFEEICRKICLNIPAGYPWKWDPQRDMAVIVLESEDAELVFYPLFKEFRHHWNFSSNPPDREDIARWVNEQFGLMPGQAVFTSYALCNLVLCVAWWPWGNEDKVSMRVGLIPLNYNRLKDRVAFRCLHRWLNISDAS